MTPVDLSGGYKSSDTQFKNRKSNKVKNIHWLTNMISYGLPNINVEVKIESVEDDHSIVNLLK